MESVDTEKTNMDPGFDPAKPKHQLPSAGALLSVGVRSIVAIAVLLGVGAGLGYVLLAIRVDPPRREFAALPPLVESMVVRADDVVEHFVGYGTARAFRSANIAAEVAATVVERVNDIRAGSAVARGQVLIRLDDRQYRHVLHRAEALADAEQASLDELTVEARSLKQLVKTAEQELRVARDEKVRVSRLFERNLAAKKEFDFASLAYQQARRVLLGYEREYAKTDPRRARVAASKRGYDAEAALAQLNIERCEITAPFGGVIHSLMVDVGDRVAPGSIALTLLDPSRVEIAIQLPASIHDRVRVGTTCRVESESQIETVWHGTVARKAPAADERTRTFAVYVIVDNTQYADPPPIPSSRGDHRGVAGGLLPGAFVRAAVRGPVHRGGILVPRGACREGRVFVVEDGVARERSVTIERFIEDRALVRGDLHNGDRVILSHLEKLADGSPVRISRRSAPAPLAAGGKKGSQTRPPGASRVQESSP